MKLTKEEKKKEEQRVLDQKHTREFWLLMDIVELIHYMYGHEVDVDDLIELIESSPLGETCDAHRKLHGDPNIR